MTTATCGSACIDNFTKGFDTWYYDKDDPGNTTEWYYAGRAAAKRMFNKPTTKAESDEK